MTKTWPRIDIEKETESIIGLFYTRSLFFVCSILVLYSSLFSTHSLFSYCSLIANYTYLSI